MACNTCKNTALNDNQRQVLEALAKLEEASGAKDIAPHTALESRQISCQLTALKKKGLVDSPVRCKYVITEQGQTALNG
jgi:predicted transcriptional regulator